MHPFLNTAVQAAQSAGDFIMRQIYKVDRLQMTEKTPQHWVSEVDIKAEQLIVDLIHQRYPSHGILGEEGGLQEGTQQPGEDACLWIIDPLDGTHNFLHEIPHYAVSIALQVNNRTEHAVIYDPVKRECFSATRGAGARCNDKKIRVASRSNLKEAMLGTSCGSQSANESYFNLMQKMWTQALGVRRLGSAALDLAYVASGRLDGAWAVGLSAWDIAAGALIIKEAGGLVGDFEGGEDFLKNQAIVAGNPKIFKAILQTIHRA